MKKIEAIIKPFKLDEVKEASTKTSPAPGTGTGTSSTVKERVSRWSRPASIVLMVVPRILST